MTGQGGAGFIQAMQAQGTKAENTRQENLYGMHIMPGGYIVRWQKATVHGESKNASPRCPHKDRGDIMGWHLLFFLKLRRYSLGGDSGAGGAFYGWRRSFITATPEALRMTALSPSTFMDAAAFKAFRMFISVCMERPILRVTPPSESCRVFPLC